LERFFEGPRLTGGGDGGKSLEDVLIRSLKNGLATVLPKKHLANENAGSVKPQSVNLRADPAAIEQFLNKVLERPQSESPEIVWWYLRLWRFRAFDPPVLVHEFRGEEHVVNSGQHSKCED
jgi:hypothetical protein